MPNNDIFKILFSIKTLKYFVSSLFDVWNKANKVCFLSFIIFVSFLLLIIFSVNKLNDITILNDSLGNLKLSLLNNITPLFLISLKTNPFLINEYLSSWIIKLYWNYTNYAIQRYLT